MSEAEKKPTNKLRVAQAEANRRRTRRALWSVLGVALVALLIGLGVVPLFQPASSARRPVMVRVPSGASVARIGDALQEKGVVRSAWAFGMYARWKGIGNKFRAGNYELSGDMTLAQITQELQTGGVRDDRIHVTIPEGFTLKQIAETLEEKGVTDGKKFLKMARSPKAIAKLQADFPLPQKTLEGYLFPDTYAFKPNSPPQQVLEAMLLNFSTRFVRPYQQEMAAGRDDLHKLVTTASLIEREAKVPEDRARIAGVLDNRLQHDMKLEIDATVLYALGHHKEKVYYKDLAVNSPYNTYRHKGLPPGPIANPGLDALRAALHPEKNDFLFYVARPNGAHYFSRTLAEHEAAKKQARLEREQQGNGTEEHPGG